MRNYFLLFFLFTLLTSCSSTQPNSFQNHINKVCDTFTKTKWYRSSKLVEPSCHDRQAYFQFHGYKNVAIEGNFNIEGVKTRYSDEPILLSGDEAFIRHVQAYVDGDTLHIRFDPAYDYEVKKPLTLRLPFQCLTGFSYKGVGNVIIKKLKTRHFDLTLQGNINAWFTGNIVLCNLTSNNDGKLVMYWVNTTCSHVTASKKGTIMLAGVSNNLDAIITDDATFDAKFLRVKTAHIRTQKNAAAHVTVTKNLNIDANDHSNVYYYERPEFFAKYMSNASAALEMKGVYPPYPQMLY